MHELAPYLRLYKKHWFSLSLGMLLALATLVASIGLLTLSGWFIAAASVAGLTIARETFNYMLPGGGVRGFAMARTAGRWGERVVSHDATFKLLADLRIFFFKKLTPLIPGRMSKLRDADLLNRLVADVDAMDHVYLRLVSPIIVGIFGIISLTLLLAWFDLTIGLTLGAILLTLLLLWPVIFYKLGKQNGETLTQNKAKLRIATLDWVQGHSELVLFGAEPKYRQAISDHQDKLVKNQFKNAHYTGLASALLLLANGWSLVLIIWMAADGVNGQPPSPMVALMAFATMASFELLMPIAGAFQYLGQTLESARRLNEILHATPDIVFPKSGVEHTQEYNLVLNHVTFQYYDSETLALDDVSLELKSGQKMAIVGQTGSGKSTLLQLLTRQFDVTSGELYIGDSPITQWTEKGLRESISVVSQRVDILNGTLKDNLHLAKPDANDIELLSILKQVGLEYLNEGLGLDTWLGDGGRQLSGGEKRRVGIARALLHNAPILLLDEPTEGLDKQTENQIMQLLNQHSKGKTVVFVTHRLVGLDRMDSICLMEQGKIVEQGSHHDLLAQQGLYHRLHQRL
ncbi:heme ABC transporter ATP-binding protein/permease CydC [Vibrio casei]|uniref:Glutathione/L-cysteine transport system ATP-binding/permease protein CydC n=1 Tax=Vibrio casei TaxID=673372 RepID=A0A368LMT8_9VIBR|nr:cysteine/glutathione ABC transporter ATP-binding protein/permease CydC [Vibrio casei]RCS73121.1 cysteine/glutathione ABC transporter ATP-binding protein/permease CydC [Vibrio casei]SJN40932.1 Transport ATP-binding protein CydC [Vibrio casei]